jgi:hypothetical protein
MDHAAFRIEKSDERFKKAPIFMLVSSPSGESYQIRELHKPGSPRIHKERNFSEVTKFSPSRAI